MALNMRQELRMSQQLVMTPQLQQAIKLLQLSRVELQDLVRSELLENPLLDDSQELGSSNDEHVSSVEMQDGIDHQRDDGRPSTDDPDPGAQGRRRSQRTTSTGRRTSRTTATPRRPDPGVRVENEDMPSLEATASRPETLAEHLEWQIRMSDFSPVEEEIAEFITRSLSRPATSATSACPQIARRSGYSPLAGGAGPAADAGSGSRSPSRPETWPRRCGSKPTTPTSRSPTRWSGRSSPSTWATSRSGPTRPSPATWASSSRRSTRRARSSWPSSLGPPVRTPPKSRTTSSPTSTFRRSADEYVVTLNDDGLPKLKISGFLPRGDGDQSRGQGVHHRAPSVGAVAHPLHPAAAADHSSRWRRAS